jgi:hypothetical protein
MRGLIRTFAVISVLVFLNASSTLAHADDHNTLVIVFKDGHRQTLSSTEVARIEMKVPAMIVYKDGHRERVKDEIDRIEFGGPASMPSRAHFIGKWEVGMGNGDHFFVTLEENGKARKTHGTPGGTWTLVDGEAHINWDDGWHDAIRKVGGGKYEKVAFEPGKSFDDEPSNVDYAKSLENRPI